MNENGKASSRATQDNRPSANADVPRLRSTELFANGNQVVIEHAGREYCLRLTAGNKLILTA